MWMYAHIHMWVCTSVQVCRCQKRASDVFLLSCFAYSFKTGSFYEPWWRGTYILLARLEVRKACNSPVSASFRIGVTGLHRMPGLFCMCSDPNSSPHNCTPSTLNHEPSPAPVNFIFKTLFLPIGYGYSRKKRGWQSSHASPSQNFFSIKVPCVLFTQTGLIGKWRLRYFLGDFWWTYKPLSAPSLDLPQQWIKLAEMSCWWDHNKIQLSCCSGYKRFLQSEGWFSRILTIF